MGRFIWNQWARYVSLSASIYLVWAGFWGILFRKFFWDFVDHGISVHTIDDGFHANATTGELLQIPFPVPNPQFNGIISVIEGIPLIQILCIVFALSMIAFDYPLPLLKGTFVHRSFTFKSIFLVFQSTTAVLMYQGTNAFIWGMIAAFAYARAEVAGELLVIDKPKGGAAKGGALPRGAARV